MIGDVPDGIYSACSVGQFKSCESPSLYPLRTHPFDGCVMVAIGHWPWLNRERC